VSPFHKALTERKDFPLALFPKEPKGKGSENPVKDVGLS